MGTEESDEWTYTFADALRGGPVPCPACGGDRWHERECPIKDRKRRYLALLLLPPLAAVGLWGIVSGRGIEVIVLAAVLAGWVLSGVLMRRLRR